MNRIFSRNLYYLSAGIFLLLAGAVLTVIVSWSIALLTDPWDSVQTLDPIYRSGRRGAYKVRVITSFGGYGFVGHGHFLRFGDNQPPLSEVPIDEIHLFDLDNPGSIFAYEAHGWPWIAMSCQYRTDGNMLVVDHGLALDGQARRPSGSRTLPRALPTEVRWAGFIGDTVFFACLIPLVLAGLRSARRRHRRARNECGHCGYSRTGSTSNTCPECGRAYSRL